MYTTGMNVFDEIDLSKKSRKVNELNSGESRNVSRGSQGYQAGTRFKKRPAVFKDYDPAVESPGG
jgi:hypothetical protein